MTVNVTLVLVIAVLVGCGTYLLTSSSVVRALLGLTLIGNGVNLVFVVAAGPGGRAPFQGAGTDPVSDPIPQALTLTAIVITLASTAFVLALAYRGWMLRGTDHFDVDEESLRLAHRDDDGPTARQEVREISAEFVEEDR